MKVLSLLNRAKAFQASQRTRFLWACVLFVWLSAALSYQQLTPLMLASIDRNQVVQKLASSSDCLIAKVSSERAALLRGYVVV